MVETSLEWQEYFSQFKIWLMRSLVASIFLYACESWTLTAELQRRIQAMEMRCHCKILGIFYKDCVTNEEVHAKIQISVICRVYILFLVRRCQFWVEQMVLFKNYSVLQFWFICSCIYFLRYASIVPLLAIGAVWCSMCLFCLEVPVSTFMKKGEYVMMGVRLPKCLGVSKT